MQILEKKDLVSLNILLTRILMFVCKILMLVFFWSLRKQVWKEKKYEILLILLLISDYCHKLKPLKKLLKSPFLLLKELMICTLFEKYTPMLFEECLHGLPLI